MPFTTDLPEQFVHPEFNEKLHKLQRISDILAGSKQLKHGPRHEDYILPYESEKNDRERYRRRRDRASFNNWFQLLVGRMGGTLLHKEPTVLGFTQTGKSWKHLVASAADHLLSYTHGGLLLNFREDERGFPDPYLTMVKGLSWTNWQFTMEERMTLTQVDIKGSYTEEGETRPQFFRLSLRSGVYVIETWRQNKNGKWELYRRQMPLVLGRPLDYLPFRPLWPTSCNDIAMPDPVLEPVAEMTIDCLRNSAQAERSLSDASVTQPVASGIRRVEDAKGQIVKKLIMGSPEAWTLDAGGSFTILEPRGIGAQLNMKAMEDKEKRLEKMVADFVDRARVPETATATTFRHVEAGYALAMLADTMTEVFTDVFSWVADLTLNPRPSFAMNKDFETRKMTPEEAKKWRELVDDQTISLETMIYQLNRGGVYGPKADLEEELGRLLTAPPPALNPFGE